MEPTLRSLWGEAAATLRRTRGIVPADLLLLAGAAGILLGLAAVAHEWAGVLRPAVAIDPSPRALPVYALYSLSRGLLAYLLSLAFALGYGYWAAKDPLAERVLLPLLDILQSIPVLGFMPAVVIGLVALFPHANVGLELAAVLMIFTGQAWNLTFSFYHSLKSIPQELREAAVVYRYSPWQRLRWLELPISAIGLVWNSMMSMAGGWFFLMITEAFVLGDRDFRLPGLGSYMSAAVARGDVPAMIWAIFAMVAMILVLDQILWRPVVAWAQKFRVEETSQAQLPTSWLLSWLRRSPLLARLRASVDRPRAPRVAAARRSLPLAGPLSRILLVILAAALALGAVRLVHILGHVPPQEWVRTAGAGGLTLGRVLLSTAIGTLWALPAGLAIGLSPRLARALQPVIQVAASFPAPMLFPAAVAVLAALGVPLGWGSVLLMLLGTQWYILFNVIAGAMEIPGDLREAAVSYRLGPWRRFRALWLPGVFPHLVTGWVTAAGGAWNASIVSEYVTYRGRVLSATGLGSRISVAAERGDFPSLAASVVTMAVIVVAFNRLVWQPCYRLAQTRYSISK